MINSNKINNKQGFTLIEIICSLVLMGFVSTIIGMGINSAVETYILITNGAEGLQKGQIIMVKLIKEFDQITEIKSIDDSSMVFLREGKEKKIYFAADENCVYFDDDTADDDPVKLADELYSFSLSYYEFFDGAATQDPESVNIIEITMKLRGLDSFEFKDRVFLSEKK